MNVELEEIRIMQNFLDVKEKPITIYRQQDNRCTPGYEEWLMYYKKELHQKCEEKLVNEFYKNLGKELFKNKFSSFQEFQHQ